MDQVFYESKPVIEEITAILERQDKTMQADLEFYHFYDIARAILTLEPEQIRTCFRIFDVDFSAEIFDYLEEDDIEPLMLDLPKPLLVNIIKKMEVDEAVDLLKYLKEHNLDILHRFPREQRMTYLKLMAFKEDQIGAFMSNSYLTLSPHITIKEAMNHVTNEAYDVDYISILYIIEAGQLIGYIRLKDLIVARATDSIEEIIETRYPIIHPQDDVEAVAKIMTETDESSLPIVDGSLTLLGIITHDDMMDIIALSEEEDYTKFAAVNDIDIDIESSNLKNSVRARLPWLMILLGLSMITSMILSMFEGRLNDSSGAILLASKLAVYLPLILGMAGNTGTQSLAVMIRYLSKHEHVDRLEIRKHLFRELRTGIFQGLIIGILIFGMINATTFFATQTIGQTELIYATVTSGSIFIALFIATILGALIPLFMHRMKIDPAVASGPFITTVSDIITLVIYYSVSMMILLPLFI